LPCLIDVAQPQGFLSMRADVLHVDIAIYQTVKRRITLGIAVDIQPLYYNIPIRLAISTDSIRLLAPSFELML